MTMAFKNPFTTHPQEVGETYLVHLCAAGGFAVKMMVAAVACLIHAFLPFVFKTTGSRRVEELHLLLQKRMHKPGHAKEAGAEESQFAPVRRTGTTG